MEPFSMNLHITPSLAGREEKVNAGIRKEFMVENVTARREDPKSAVFFFVAISIPLLNGEAFEAPWNPWNTWIAGQQFLFGLG